MLCRILTELKLLSTSVGVIVLSAGVGNDVVGWILLALCVALVNAGTGLVALWVLLVCIAWTLFLVFAVRPVFMIVLIRTRSLQDGPSQAVIALTLLIALTSAFFTGVIGVHPIFGAFLAGLICPHEGGFAIKVTEKVEDLVTTLFLPLYFALSGLSTNLGLLNSGTTWAYVFGVIAVAFFGKLIGGSGAARLNGLVWRECFTIGALMSCKGLVELIVLNIGLQAKILSTRTFTIFVVMALVTTFATTPLTSALYPPWYQKKLEAWKRGEIDWDTGRPLDDTRSPDLVALEKDAAAPLHRILIYLRLDSMPGLLTFIALFGGANTASSAHQTSTTHKPTPSHASLIPLTPTPTTIHGVRLIELTERESSVMRVSEVDEASSYDPLVNTFRAVGRLHNVAVSGEVDVVPTSYYSDVLASRAAELASDLLLLPWSDTGSMSEAPSHILSTSDANNTGPYNDFIAATLDAAQCNTAVFLDRGFSGVARTPIATPLARRLSRTVSGLSARGAHGPAMLTTPSSARMTHRLFVPFTGGPDCRLAVRLALHLALDERVSVSVVHFHRAAAGDNTATTSNSSAAGSEAPSLRNGFGGKKAAHATVTVEGASSSAAGASGSARRDGGTAFLAVLRASLIPAVAGRVSFNTIICGEEEADADVAARIVERAKGEMGGESGMGDVVVLGRNVEGDGDAGGQSCLGRVGESVARAVPGSVLVVQARRV